MKALLYTFLGVICCDGDNDLNRRLTCASSCFLRGDADASTTLRPLIMFNAGRSSGKGARRGRGCDTAVSVAAARSEAS